MGKDSAALVLPYLTLARKIARSFAWRFDDVIDSLELQSLAYEEMVRCAPRYEPKYGLTFGAWVRPYVQDRLRRAVGQEIRRRRREISSGQELEIAAEAPRPDGSTNSGVDEMAGLDAQRLLAAALRHCPRALRQRVLQALASGLPSSELTGRAAAQLRRAIAKVREEAQAAFAEPAAELSTAAAAALLGVTARAVRKMAQTGRLATSRSGGHAIRVYGWSVELVRRQRAGGR